MPATTIDEIHRPVRTAFRSTPVRELLNDDVTALLGVDAAAGTVLGKLEIHSVFDLATSAVFDAATAITEAGARLTGLYYQHGKVPADIIKQSLVTGVSVEELQFLPISVLEQISDALAAELEAALDVRTILELASYAPYLSAKRMLDAAYFPENLATFDPERPDDLLPASGDYPTERVQYTTLLMDEIPVGDGDQFVDLSDPDFQPLDLKKLEQMDAGFKRVAYGALLTYRQSWYAHGVTLGQLLHSTSLAPGESTRLAVIDWSRRSRAGQTEAIDETDDLTNDQSQNRAISEVTSAVATEAQGGFSSTNTNSTAKQSSTAEAGESSGGLVGSILGGGSSSWGSTTNEASSSSHADSYSSSWGRRDVGSTMAQNINDRTHQHAHSSRSRRASVVKEVAQSEHENISTRVIANYNHMHALTVQYYEVVQIYRVEVELAAAEKVVFIPVALADFDDDAMIRRYQSVLAAAALSLEMRSALRNLDVIELQPEPKTRFSIFDRPLDVLVKEAVYAKPLKSAAMIAKAAAPPPATEDAKDDADPKEVTLAGIRSVVSEALADSVAKPDVAAAQTLQLNPAISVAAQINDKLWSIDQVARLSGFLNLSVLRPNSSAVYLPNDVLVENAVVVASGLSLSAVLRSRDGAVLTFSQSTPVALSQVGAIGVTGSNSGGEVAATVTLTLNRNGVRFPLELPAVAFPKGFTGETKIVKVNAGAVDANVRQHLKANRLHYSQAIFRSLDAAQIALLLSGYRVEAAGQTVPVAQVVEPLPVRYVGNYLAFRMGVDPERDETWQAWLKERHLDEVKPRIDIVPLGTGGTFAEAVLGRSNSAEKLDITRFWNWQDSPIPLQPTEIAAIQSGSRAMDENVTPGQLSAPIVNLMTPAALPDPMGTAAVLTALQNGNMFRDMSGLQGTIGLAQAALQATAAGATAAGQQAGTNMQNHLQAQTERMRIAADLAKSAIAAAAGVPATGDGGKGSASNHSQDGAKVNYFDKTAKPATNGASGGSGAAIEGGGSTSGGAGVIDGSGGSAANGVGADGYSQNPGILSATWGDDKPVSSSVGNLIDRIVGSDEDPQSGNVALGNATAAWPYLDKVAVLDRIKLLRGDPDLFDQGRMGLCTAAAFYHHALQRSPDKMAQLGNALLGQGVGYLGNLKIRAGYDLRHADYSKLAAASPPFVPQAEWMLMSSLRDSENIWFDFEGGLDEGYSMETSAKELSGWYDDTGFYSDVSYTDDTSIAKIKLLKKTATNQLALWIRTNMISPGSNTGHMISVETPITIDPATNTISFDYWTWGQVKPYQKLSMSLANFQKDYFGAITATF
jgi:hypothetical protein